MSPMKGRLDLSDHPRKPREPERLQPEAISRREGCAGIEHNRDVRVVHHRQRQQSAEMLGE